MSNAQTQSLLSQLQGLNEHELRRLLTEHLTQQKVGLYWESNSIARDAALNADVVLPRLVEAHKITNTLLNLSTNFSRFELKT